VCTGPKKRRGGGDGFKRGDYHFLTAGSARGMGNAHNPNRPNISFGDGRGWVLGKTGLGLDSLGPEAGAHSRLSVQKGRGPAERQTKAGQGRAVHGRGLQFIFETPGAEECGREKNRNVGQLTNIRAYGENRAPNPIVGDKLSRGLDGSGQKQQPPDKALHQKNRPARTSRAKMPGVSFTNPWHLGPGRFEEQGRSGPGAPVGFFIVPKLRFQLWPPFSEKHGSKNSVLVGLGAVENPPRPIRVYQ